ncbi:KUP/HAK/KT family potassium transporter [Roseimicrobium sp. ORNL1]|uniref:potassium transporter Kup n=1 Tax=Roseimicrobium sp. ORNL1 TaxID=2711231 RepID=UPI0013E19267|nr:KUP/HAK/KT family potassium transporter [Roseimicrobium sp. ORNL1]QIF00618.1 potassium transporter [Roseimicrobium sp. ORNL1]
MNNPHHARSWAVAVAALGVVYGDIGTSPLYALRECFGEGRFLASDPVTVLGPVSLMLWSFILIVSIKYLLILVHATNQGEGGVFALLSILKHPEAGLKKEHLKWLGLFAIIGAALLYGDGVITPAISVLSAVEGLEEINPEFEKYVVPVAVAILLAVFLVQRHGTHRIGAGFGPIMLIWFGVLGALGVYNLMQYPAAAAALSPHYGIRYLIEHGHHGLGIMGSVLLCVTGCEALYADIGHFGRTAMQRSWFLVAFPGLALNYLGQAALVLRDPTTHESPFFRLAPQSLLLPLVILSTLATIIASQAMITGVFSLTQQAVQLGFLPRLKIKHTNPDVRGQIYLPQINLLLCVCCLALVLAFGSSSKLAAAYGLTVSANMMLTSSLLLIVVTRLWKWPWWKGLVPVILFLIWESTYVAGSLAKLFHGAWMPLLLTLLLWILMKTWQDGRALLWRIMTRGQIPIDHLISELENKRIPRVRGTGVFMSGSSDGMPLVLLHHLKHNKSLHERVVLLTVAFLEEPYATKEERFTATELMPDFYRVVLRYGFVESPDVMRDLCRALAVKRGGEMSNISFYQARELLLPTGKSGMAPWRKKLYIFLSRIARPATGYFDLPSRQVIELGIQMEL